MSFLSFYGAPSLNPAANESPNATYFAKLALLETTATAVSQDFVIIITRYKA
jgi:hypothetical protein